MKSIRCFLILIQIMLLTHITVFAKGMGEPPPDGLELLNHDNVIDAFDYHSLFDRLFLEESIFESRNRQLKSMFTPFLISDGLIGYCFPESEYDTSSMENDIRVMIVPEPWPDISLSAFYYDIWTSYLGITQFPGGDSPVFGGSFSWNGLCGIKFGFGDSDHYHDYDPLPVWGELSVFNVYARCLIYTPNTFGYDNVKESKIDFEGGYRIDTRLSDSPIIDRSVLYLGFEQDRGSWLLKGLFYELYPLEFVRMNANFRYCIYNDEAFDFSHWDCGLELTAIIGDHVDFNISAGAGASISNRIRGELISGWMVHASVNIPMFRHKTEAGDKHYFASNLTIDFKVAYNYNDIITDLPLINHYVNWLSVGFGI